MQFKDELSLLIRNNCKNNTIEKLKENCMCNITLQNLKHFYRA